MIAIGVDIASGSRAQTALVALGGDRIAFRRAWKGSAPTLDVVEYLADLVDEGVLVPADACAVVEEPWRGKNDRTFMALAMEAGGWVRMLQAVGIVDVRTALPSVWRTILPRSRRRGHREGEKDAAERFARMAFGDGLTVHEAEAVCMATWVRQMVQGERRLRGVISGAVDAPARPRGVPANGYGRTAGQAEILEAMAKRNKGRGRRR